MTATGMMFEELRRYARFEAADEAHLRAVEPIVAPHFPQIVDEFYARAMEHEAAFRVFTNPEQIERHKQALLDWFAGFFRGPWNEAYFQRRARIGRVHVEIALPQRFMFGAMSLIRTSLSQIVERARERPELERRAQVAAIHKLLDIELAIMLESYREAYVDRVQHRERLERDDLQRRLAVSEARYGEIVEKGEALITTLDRTGHVLLINHKCEQLTGISREAAHGRSWFELFIVPEDRDAVRARCDQALAGRSTPYEGALHTAAGGPARVRWHFTTLPDGDEPVLCAMGIDVTHEHELGIRTRRAERLAALGTITAGLAHEIRNPLNAAHLQLSVAERRLERGDPDIASTKAAVNTAATELERLGTLVQEFLQFARPQALQLTRVNLRDTLETCVAQLKREASKRGATLRVASGPEVTVEADEEKLGQVVLNLVRNALDVVGSGGQVELSALARGTSAELTVRDDGPGVPKDLPIFEPFFTTKENGTGMGLAIVHRIVMDHGGQVAVQSVPGDTRFTVSLPRMHNN
jgi:PAS domain S-box-containing protein